MTFLINPASARAFIKRRSSGDTRIFHRVAANKSPCALESQDEDACDCTRLTLIATDFPVLSDLSSQRIGYVWSKASRVTYLYTLLLMMTTQFPHRINFDLDSETT